MLSFEQSLSETTTPTPVEDGNALVGDVDTEPTELITVQETPTSAAARMLELAAVTADRLVTDAETEAGSLVTDARARADAILEASRNEADQVAAELASTKEEQAAELDRERATALAELNDERAALEAEIATLRQMESHHRSQMRHHLTEQLSMLDATLPEPPAVFAG
jgi:cell division septum initiation protein DivIVA